MFQPILPLRPHLCMTCGRDIFREHLDIRLGLSVALLVRRFKELGPLQSAGPAMEERPDSRSEGPRIGA